MIKNLKENYSPFYFLASLGNGGLTVAFFIFFMFLTAHPHSPIATFDSVRAALTGAPTYILCLSALAYAFMLYYAVNHVRFLLWNIREYRLYKKTSTYRELIEGNNEITLMVIPLTLTMSINVMFVLGAMLVPGLWGVVEILFPFAFLAFLATGIYGLTVFYRFYSKLLLNGHFQHSMNNSLAQMLSSFTFAMSAVGFAAPAAMSQNRVMVAVAAFFSIAFFAIATLLAMKNLVLGFYSMLDKGINRDSSATIWILIPILTLLGIATIRLRHGLAFLFDSHGNPAFLFIFCTTLVALQIFFGILGYIIMRKNKYFPEFIHGCCDTGNATKTPATYALICPGVAFWVFGMFFLDKALVHGHLLSLFSTVWFILLLPLLMVLVKTMQINWKLNKRILFSTDKN